MINFIIYHSEIVTFIDFEDSSPFQDHPLALIPPARSKPHSCHQFEFKDWLLCSQAPLPEFRESAYVLVYYLSPLVCLFVSFGLRCHRWRQRCADWKTYHYFVQDPCCCILVVPDSQLSVTSSGLVLTFSNLAPYLFFSRDCFVLVARNFESHYFSSNLSVYLV